MPLGASEAQHECPVCFQKFSPDAISIHCDTHFAVDNLAPDNSQDDEVLVVDAPRPQPVTHNRRSAYVPQRTQAPTSSATVAREPQDPQSPDLSPLLCRSLAAQAAGQAHVTGDVCEAYAYHDAQPLGICKSNHCFVAIGKLSSFEHVSQCHLVQAIVATSTQPEVTQAGDAAGETCR